MNELFEVFLLSRFLPFGCGLSDFKELRLKKKSSCFQVSIVTESLGFAVFTLISD